MTEAQKRLAQFDGSINQLQTDQESVVQKVFNTLQRDILCDTQRNQLQEEYARSYRQQYDSAALQIN